MCQQVGFCGTFTVVNYVDVPVTHDLYISFDIQDMEYKKGKYPMFKTRTIVQESSPRSTYPIDITKERRSDFHDRSIYLETVDSSAWKQCLKNVAMRHLVVSTAGVAMQEKHLQAMLVNLDEPVTMSDLLSALEK
ncbi:hypothetical protein J6590_078533 [Homalodisca vitripennis]|nr:hypothetical protein J6590_078533 [Homalodisca vitripennis]